MKCIQHPHTSQYVPPARPPRPINQLHGLLVLDFDGVLQTPAYGDWLDMEHAHHLEGLLTCYPDIRVLVSSSHREGRSLSEIRRLLPKVVAARTIGATPVLPLGRANGGRQQEVEAWIRAASFRGPWVAVDDEAHLFKVNSPHLVLTHRLVGWTSETTEEVLNRLMNASSQRAQEHVRHQGWQAPGFDAVHR